MAATTVAGCLRDKSILITGSTGFLGKLLVEKILRVQPGVKKLYLLVRAPDAASAKKRVHTEPKLGTFLRLFLHSMHQHWKVWLPIVENDLFNSLREQHGANFNRFIDAKINPLAGDIVHDNFGCKIPEIKELSEEINIIINGAAMTKFYERYDVALASNALGVLYLVQFAKKCANLKIFLHVSTAYVAGEQEGILLEQPLKMGESRKQSSNLDIEAEILLIEGLKSNLKQRFSGISDQLENRAMKDFGMKRAKYFGWPNTYVLTKAMGEMLLSHLGGDLPVVIIRPSIVSSTIKDPMPGWIEGIRTMDTIIIGYGEQTIPCFLGDRNSIIDVIPGDMVINAILVAVATHWNENTQVIYHVSSSHENQVPLNLITESMYRYFYLNGSIGSNATRKEKRLLLFHTYAYFFVYTFIVYMLPIEVLHIMNILICGLFSRRYNMLNRNYNRLMILAKMYAPYAFCKGRFDGTNLTRLRTVATMDYSDAPMYNFDPKCINWASYFLDIHIPAVVKHACKKKQDVR